ncbi:MFS transporter [Saccharopolyspora sp. K220]|uniref:MFS transporter n=1 Tax=Saccharopolyspora soli TaxID=2926618 RepID=UPI001F595670|nr:MFS transporter [Saccharopolyspora soli]MCI2423004.1 MFS transporter [Saccharopolyspora soli]
MTSTATKTPEGSEEVETGPNLTHRQIVTILIGLMSGMFLAALDQTIVSTSIVRIANDLNGFDLQAWITTAYLITSTIATPIYGKLSDIYGRKPLYLIAITVFVIGSLASTFAQSMYELAAFRAVQGLGAGGLMSLAMTILGDIVPPRQRAKYQGFFLAVFGVSTVLGPVLGGLFSGIDELASLDGWRWVFLVNVPIGIVALAVVAKVLNVPHERHNHRIDWWGGLFLAVAVVPLLLIAEQGNKWGWASTDAIICYAIAAVGVLLFLLIEHVMKDAALIPLRLFKNSTFTVAILGGVIVGVAMFGAITMIPQYLQVVQGYTPTESGLLTLPLMAGIMSASIMSGQITSRTGRYKFLPVIGTFLVAVGATVFAQVEYNSPLWLPLVAAGIIGFGLGNCMQTLIIAVQNAGPRKDMGVSTAAATFFRQMGGTMGVAVFLTVLFNVLPGNIEKAFGGSLPAAASGQLGSLQSNTGVIEQLPDALRIPVLIGFTESITTVFYVAAGVALLACLVLMFMKEIPLAGGQVAAASAVEGGEALLDDALVDAPAKPVWTEPESTSDGRALVGAGKHALSNGHGGYQHAPTVPMSVAAPVLSISGHVRRHDGTSVDGAVLTLIDQDGRQVSKAVGSRDGSYRIDVPEAGRHVLIVSATGYQPEASSVVVAESSPTLDITLTGSGELTGVVRSSSQGTPLAGVTVTLTDERGEVNGAFVTQDDGGYAFRGVGAGNYTVVASGERFRPVALTLTVPDSGLLRHDIELSTAVPLSGTVRTVDGRVVPDARITVIDTEGKVAAVAGTDTEGQYLIGDLPEGDYTVVASGYLPVSAQVNLFGDGATHDVQLSHGTAGELAETS